MTPPPPRTRSPLFVVTTLFFIAALAGNVILIGVDVLHGFALSTLHQHLDALPLMMIGLSYIALQLASTGDRADRIKGIFLGIAFLCWGGEQLLPTSKIVTLLDEGAVTIFVVDVSLVIWSRIRRPESPNLP